MRICVPLLGERVAPRCSIADGVLLLIFGSTQITSRVVVPLERNTWIDFQKVLIEHNAEVLICGGIRREDREAIQARHINIIDNVVGTVDEVIEALRQGKLHPGYGLATIRSKNPDWSEVAPPTGLSLAGIQTPETAQSEQAEDGIPGYRDCLACSERICLLGEQCQPAPPGSNSQIDLESRLILESALDIATEEERRLCRLAELIYFCLEMDYHKIGLAFCTDLFEPAEILARVLRRFFDVYPISCKIGGNYVADSPASGEKTPLTTGTKRIACNPLAQAKLFNRLNTDLNIIVGLCVGADCLFIKASHAPVTTLFVKDKSLANNPIGALYSDYYLKEATHSRIPTG